VIGATPLRVTVRPRAGDLAAHNLTAADVEERLRAAGRSLPAGRVREGANVRPLVVAEPLRSLDAVKQLTIGGTVLSDIADVALAEVPDGSAFAMGSSGVLLRVYRAPNANAVALARAVRERVEDL